MIVLLWLCLATITYVYAGYPLLLRLGIFGRPRNWDRGLRRLPLVSVIVPAHNEEASIAAKIKNLLASEYPPEQLEILVGSDGSSDRTDAIVQRYAARGVGLVSFPQQLGKSAIQNGLVALANGEILVFTDADCFSAPATLRILLDSFADPTVGLVTGRPRFANARETQIANNEGFYLKYETWIREQESSRGLLAMASGSLFAMRRELWAPLDRALGDDFALPLRVAGAGFRCVLEPRAVAVTRLTQDATASMFRMKVRVIAKDFRALLSNASMLNPLRYGRIAVALWSHKLLRWFVPYFQLALFMANAGLLRDPFLRTLFIGQITFYGLAAIGAVIPARKSRRIFSIPASFCVVNFASLIGTLKCLLGRASGKWTPERKAVATASLETRRVRT